MEYQKINKSSSWNPTTPPKSTKKMLQSYPLQGTYGHNAPPSKVDIENEAFNQNKFEAFGLQLKEKNGTITPVEQERLGVLQAKMDDFWAQRMEQASARPSILDKMAANIQKREITQPSITIQPKLTIGQPNDKYEQEADQVAAQVVQQINAPTSNTSQGDSVQRQEMVEEEEVAQTKPEISTLQRKEIPEADEVQAKPDTVTVQRQGAEGGAVSADLEGEINAARGSGQGLAPDLQAQMGQAMGADFSGVRVHTDARADMLNRSVGARAFTTGQDVFFKGGEYQPGSQGGQELIAHELTHVVQQSGSGLQRAQLPQQQSKSKIDLKQVSGYSAGDVTINSHSDKPASIQRFDDEEMEFVEAFGHTHRNIDIDPDVVGEGRGGIHQAAPDSARPEDAPLMNEFRQGFHKLHSAKLYMERNHPNLIEEFEADQAQLLQNVSLEARLMQIAGAVKNESKAHKKRVKSLSTNTDIEVLRNQYEEAIRDLGEQALALANRITEYINQHLGNDVDEVDLNQIHEEGTDIWREKWHAALLAVNRVLSERWGHWRGQIQTWIQTRHDEDNLPYMDAEQRLELDYIGSLAKGYKGPPKQGIRFTPERFDVDANLISPPLAVYALTVGGAMIDRGRIWSRAAGPALYDGLLHPMENNIQDELEGAGLLDLGMTARDDEPFEVVIDIEGIEELMGAPEDAIQSKQLSERDRTIRDRLHGLRHEDPERFTRVGVELQQAGFTTDPDDLGHFFLTEHNDEEQTYAFNDEQLDQIEQIINDTE